MLWKFIVVYEVFNLCLLGGAVNHVPVCAVLVNVSFFLRLVAACVLYWATWKGCTHLMRYSHQNVYLAVADFSLDLFVSFLAIINGFYFVPFCIVAAYLIGIAMAAFARSTGRAFLRQ